MEASRKERDKRRRNKQIQFGVGIAAILAIIIFAGWAEISRIEAEEQSSLATARQLAAQSLNRPDDQFDLALLLSSKANDIRDDMETRASLFELLERNPRLITSLNSTSYAIEHAAFSPNGNVLISVSPDGGIQSWDISNSKPAIISLGGNSGYFPFSTLSPDGKMLALAEYTGRIVLWDVYADREIAKFGNYDQFSVLSLAFNPQSTLLASGHEDGTISLWDIGNHGSQNHGSQVELYSELPADDQWIADLAFSPDNKTLASASGSIRLWDVESGIEACPNITLENESTARCPRFSPNGKILAFGDIDGGIYIWNITTNQWQKLPMSHNGQVDSLAISRDGSLLASGGFDKTINLWDLKSGKLIDSTLRGHKLGIKSLEFSPDSRILASTGGLDHKIMLWDANIIPISRIGTLLTDRADPYSILASSLNGETLVSGGSDGKIIFWDSEKRKSIGVPLIQNGPVSTMEFNPNGTLLATGSGNGNITIWNVKTGQQIDLSYEGGVVQCLAFSHDSSKLASMDENHFIMWIQLQRDPFFHKIWRKT